MVNKIRSKYLILIVSLCIIVSPIWGIDQQIDKYQEEIKKVYRVKNYLDSSGRSQEYFEYQYLINPEVYVATQFMEQVKSDKKMRDKLNIGKYVFVGTSIERPLEEQVYKELLVQVLEEGGVQIKMSKEEMNKYAQEEMKTIIEELIGNEEIKGFLEKQGVDKVFKGLQIFDDVQEVGQSLTKILSLSKQYSIYSEYLEIIIQQTDNKYLKKAAQELMHELKVPIQAINKGFAKIIGEIAKEAVEETLLKNIKTLSNGIMVQVEWGVVLGRFIGNVELGAGEMTAQAIKTIGYAEIAESLSKKLVEEEKNFKQVRGSIEAAQDFKSLYEVLRKVRISGEESYKLMRSHDKALVGSFLKKITDYKEIEEFCEDNIERLERYQFKGTVILKQEEILINAAKAKIESLVGTEVSYVYKDRVADTYHFMTAMIDSSPELIYEIETGKIYLLKEGGLWDISSGKAQLEKVYGLEEVSNPIQTKQSYTKFGEDILKHLKQIKKVQIPTQMAEVMYDKFSMHALHYIVMDRGDKVADKAAYLVKLCTRGEMNEAEVVYITQEGTAYQQDEYSGKYSIHPKYNLE